MKWKKLCFEENEDINITEYTQIAMLADEVAILKVLEAKGIKADITAGLSLGEYGARLRRQTLWFEGPVSYYSKSAVFHAGGVSCGRCDDGGART